MKNWLENHIDIWYRILTDAGTDESKVKCLTNLIRLVKEEMKE